MRIKIKHFPQHIIQQNHINAKVTKTSWVCIKIKNEMPGLKQAALLVCDHLNNSLAPCVYHLVQGIVGLWKYEIRPTKFCLCVDDFGIKFWSKDDAQHLCNAIGANFNHNVDHGEKITVV